MFSFLPLFYKSLALTVLIAILLSAQTAAQPLTLTVDSNHILREGANHFVGVNLNYLRDSDANRPAARPLDTALRDMGARWLRYPGGEKSDFYLWSQPPYDRPHPMSLGWYATVRGTRMDFDQYIAHARAAGAEPYIVAGYDTEARTGRTKAQWIESAVAWVRYANKVKHYGVKYWEIGNENWNNHKASPEEMAQIVAEFSQAMKAVDPTIKIGSSGNSDGWWSKFLPLAAPHLDFLTLSLYNAWGWKSYDRFAQSPAPALIGDARTALNAIDHYAPVADRPRLRVIVSETNSKDFSEGGWPGTNTLGHCLVTFATLGALMQRPRVLTAMVWTTRWIKDEEAENSQWYALGPQNEILPTGRAIALWGQFVQDKMVAIDGGSDLLSAYASRSANGKAMTVWLLNRGSQPITDIRIAIKSPVAYRQAVTYQLAGTGPDDAYPHWGQTGTMAVKGNALPALSCPGVSVTVVLLRSKQSAK